MTRVHRHRCQDCQTPVECGGEWEQNFDGVPEVTCPEFHLPGGAIAEWRCDACEAAYWAEVALSETVDDADRADALIALVHMAPDRAFAREWLDRGGHYSVLRGIPAKQDRLRRTLPLRYANTMRQERAE